MCNTDHKLGFGCTFIFKLLHNDDVTIFEAQDRNRFHTPRGRFTGALPFIFSDGFPLRHIFHYNMINIANTVQKHNE